MVGGGKGKGRKCHKCGRPVKGHPRPVGDNCTLYRPSPAHPPPVPGPSAPEPQGPGPEGPPEPPGGEPDTNPPSGDEEGDENPDTEPDTANPEPVGNPPDVPDVPNGPTPPQPGEEPEEVPVRPVPKPRKPPGEQPDQPADEVPTPSVPAHPTPEGNGIPFQPYGGMPAYPYGVPGPMYYPAGPMSAYNGMNGMNVPIYDHHPHHPGYLYGPHSHHVPGQPGIVASGAVRHPVQTIPGMAGSTPMVRATVQPGINIPSHGSNTDINDVSKTLTYCGNLLAGVTQGGQTLNNSEIAKLINDCVYKMNSVVNDPRGQIPAAAGAWHQTANQSHPGAHVGLAGNPMSTMNGGACAVPTAGNGFATPTPSHHTVLAGTGLAPPTNGHCSTMYSSNSNNHVNAYDSCYVTASGVPRAGSRNPYQPGTMAHKLRAQGVSSKAIDSAIEGEYIELSDFLAPIGASNNVTNSDLEAIFDNDNNSISYRPRSIKRKIYNHDTWSQAWVAYEKLMVATFGSNVHEVLADYRASILEMSKKYLWSAVAVYDFRHRSRLATFVSLPERLQFSMVFPDLTNTILDTTAIRPNAVKCQRCKAYDHLVKDCPFPETAKSGSSQVKAKNEIYEICQNFNREKCTNDRCKRRHVCKNCRGPLPQTKCLVSGACANRSSIPPQ